VEPFGVLVRWAHVLAASLVVGVFAFLVLVGRPAARAAGPEALARFAGLDARLVRLGGWALGLALASGGLDLWRQLSVATGLGLRESLTPEAVEALLFQTRYGAVWLLRHGLLALLGVFLVFREEPENGADRLALRLEGLALGLVTPAGRYDHQAHEPHTHLLQRSRKTAPAPEQAPVVRSGTLLGLA